MAHRWGGCVGWFTNYALLEYIKAKKKEGPWHWSAFIWGGGCISSVSGRLPIRNSFHYGRVVHQSAQTSAGFENLPHSFMDRLLAAYLGHHCHHAASLDSRIWYMDLQTQNVWIGAWAMSTRNFEAALLKWVEVATSGIGDQCIS